MSTKLYNKKVEKLNKNTIFLLIFTIFLLVKDRFTSKISTFGTSLGYIVMERKRINRLKVVLAEKGMTNKQLAETLGKDSAVISKWVTNVALPNVEMFIQLARILEVSVNDLLWIDDNNL